MEKRQPKAYEVDVAGTSLGVFCQNELGKSGCRGKKPGTPETFHEMVV